MAIKINGTTVIDDSKNATFNNLTVNGITTTVNSNSLIVDDKNIELGAVVQITGVTATLAIGVAVVTVSTTAGMIPGQSLTKTAGTGAFGASAVIVSVDSATQFTATVNHVTAGEITFTVGGATDVTADSGGITLIGTTNKTLNWINATEAWTSSEHLNLASTKEYRIGGISVLTSSTLGSGVTSSSLTSLGLNTAGFVKTNASGVLSVDTTSYLSLGGGTMTGAITFAAGQTWPTFNQNTTGTARSVSATVTDTNSAALVSANMADSDLFRILVGGTASNAGFVEIATADDGNEPIYVRQYSGVFDTLVRTATLLDSSGNTAFPGKLSANEFQSLSDENTKKNIQTIENATDTIGQLRGVEFDWKDESGKSSGVIAQELERALPHLVRTDDDGCKTVNYNGLIAYLIESNKEMHERIKVLENK